MVKLHLIFFFTLFTVGVGNVMYKIKEEVGHFAMPVIAGGLT